MIFDAVISLFSLVVDFIAGLLIAATFPIVNAVFALIELVVGLFTSAFSLPRLDRATAKDSSKAKAIVSAIVTATIVFSWAWFSYKDRTVTLTGADGHTLPFASVIVTADGQIAHTRTDESGNLDIPRFGHISLTVKDARYSELTLTNDSISRVVVVERTSVGGFLDETANFMIDKAKQTFNEKTNNGN